MIISFSDEATSDLYHGITSTHVHRLPPVIVKSVLRKLDMLNAADRLTDLRTPPGNRLKALKSDFTGFYSIRVNDQWRIIFQWIDSNACNMSLIDYH